MVCRLSHQPSQSLPPNNHIRTVWTLDPIICGIKYRSRSFISAFCSGSVVFLDENSRIQSFFNPLMKIMINAFHRMVFNPLDHGLIAPHSEKVWIVKTYQRVQTRWHVSMRACDVFPIYHGSYTYLCVAGLLDCCFRHAVHQTVLVPLRGVLQQLSQHAQVSRNFKRHPRPTC